MTAALEWESKRLAEPIMLANQAVRAAAPILRASFSRSAEASRYLSALASLLFNGSAKVSATLTTGAPRDDFTAEEIAGRLASGAIDKLRFALQRGEHLLHI